MLSQLTFEQGWGKILGKFKEHFAPYLESALPRAFEKAIEADHRKAKETLQDFVVRMDNAFKELNDEGVSLNDTAKGYVILRHASFTQAQEDQMTTWTKGLIEEDFQLGERMLTAMKESSNVFQANSTVQQTSYDVYATATCGRAGVGRGGDDGERRAKDSAELEAQKRSKVVKYLNPAEPPSYAAAASPANGYACSYLPPPYPVEEANTYPETSSLTSFMVPMDKHNVYAMQILQGINVGRRKCAKTPSKEIEKCSHPKTSLAGAGNAVQKEVWFQECHARWKVSPTVPTKPSQKVANRVPVVCLGSGGGEDPQPASSIDAHEEPVQSGHGPAETGQRATEDQGATDEGNGTGDGTNQTNSTRCLTASSAPAATSTTTAAGDASNSDSIHARAGAVGNSSSRRGQDAESLQRCGVSAGSGWAHIRTEESHGDQQGANPNLRALQKEEGKVSAGVWRWSSDGQLQYEPGILPGQIPDNQGLFVGVLEELPEEDFLDTAEGVLKKGCRKRTLRAMTDPKIGEVYSAPRITAEAQRQGMPVAGAYDQRTGFDVKCQHEQERCFRKLEEEDPDVLARSPSCGLFSSLQAWNYGRMQFKRGVFRKASSIRRLP
eukprot:s321_g21.t1